MNACRDLDNVVKVLGDNGIASVKNLALIKPEHVTWPSKTKAGSHAILNAAFVTLNLVKEKALKSLQVENTTALVAQEVDGAEVVLNSR